MSGLIATALRFTYGTPRHSPAVLDDLTLTLPPATITAIVGPNGCGKSTLLKVLLGVLQPHAGRVELHGHNVHALSATQRSRQLVFIPQHATAVMGFTVAEYLSLGIVNRTKPTADLINQTLARLELADRANDTFANLSAGQQQRATLARALIQLQTGQAHPQTQPRPQVLLADEPTGAMDPRHQLAAAQLFKDLAAQGVAVAIVLHDLTLAQDLATHAIVLTPKGRTAAAGPTQHVLVPSVLNPTFGVTFQPRQTLIAQP